MANFILNLKLDTQKHHVDVLNKRFEIGRIIYNQILSKGIRNRKLMLESKAYRKALKFYRETEADTPEREEASALLSSINLDYNFSEYALHAAVAEIKRNYECHFDINTAQKIATHAWKALSKVHFGNGKRVHFKKYGQLNTLEGKTNKSGIRYKDGFLMWGKLTVPVIIRKNDYYAHEALLNKVKYVRIVRKVVGTKYQFYIQLVLDGIPPQKGRDYSRNKGKVGIDPGTSTMAVVSNDKAMLVELAPKIETNNAEIRELSRKLDRSRRVTNPNNYNEDGTIKKKKGVRVRWIRSKRYMKTLFKLKDAYRRRSEYIRRSHLAIVHQVLEQGIDVYTETMSYKSLSKHSSKPTEYNAKTGKCKRKKRFGKSLNNRAPALFLELLNMKLGYCKKKLKKVNTTTFKASQYNHLTDTYTKKSLGQRWNKLDHQLIQRDLYSAFLLMNSKANLEETNRKSCISTYDTFKKNHAVCMAQLMLEPKAPKSFGLERYKKVVV